MTDQFGCVKKPFGSWGTVGSSSCSGREPPVIVPPEDFDPGDEMEFVVDAF